MNYAPNINHPRENPLRERYGDHLDVSETALQRFLELGFIQLLLVGMYALLERGWSRAEKQAYRERAYRVRGAVQIATRGIETRVNNKAVIKEWSRSVGPTWLGRMSRLWNLVPSDRIKSVTPASCGVRLLHRTLSRPVPARGGNDIGFGDNSNICAPP